MIMDKRREMERAKVFADYARMENDMMYFSTGGRTGTIPMRLTPEHITEMKEHEIFVFGSNAQGYHGGGAAAFAMKHFGAVWGQGDGLQGQSYAISTMEGLVATARNVNCFVHFAAEHPENRFYVTAIGCGIAGYTPLQMAPLFIKAILLPNVFLPRIFWEYFWMTVGEHHPEYFVPSDEWKDWDK